VKVAVLFSGGKDSTFALYKAKKEGHEIVSLVTMESKSPESYMFHIPNTHLTEYAARAMNLPLIFAETSGEKEKELEDLEKVLKDLKKEKKIEGVVSGAVASSYQKERVDAICAKLKLKSIAPLWERDQFELMSEIIDAHFEVIVVGVAAYGLNESWLGRPLDEEALQELLELNRKNQLSVVGEGGEFETLVVDCPLFKEKIVVLEVEKRWDGIRGEMVIKEVELVKK